MPGRGAVYCLCVLVSGLLAGCAEPPSREMDQAQGAIDAARAAGADEYATTEFAAATAALQHANDAVTVGDYRLALNYALESREHAQNAARDAADTKARMRSVLDQELADLEVRIAGARASLDAAGTARAQQRTLREYASDLADATKDLQEARARVAAGDYLDARMVLDGLIGRLDPLLAAIADATTAQSPRRRP